MHKEKIKRLIDCYIKAYNEFDINGMVSCMHPDIAFKNVSNGKVNMTSNGLKEFRAIAERTVPVFKERCQTITKCTIAEDQAYIEVDYKCTIAKDIPNGFKAGEVLILHGKSEMKFKNNLIISLEDYS